MLFSGSHDSGSYWLDKSLGVTEDESPALRFLVSKIPCIASIVYRWSKTQSQSIQQQLENGVRYLDLRVYQHPKNKEIRIGHGLYGRRLDDVLEEVRTFLREADREIVLLDFNHLIGIDNHQEVLNLITSKFEGKLIPPADDLTNLTLENIWNSPQRVVVFYAAEVMNRFPSVWFGQRRIKSPWPNTTKPSHLKRFLNYNYDVDDKPGVNEFYVWQGVLTPTYVSVVRRLWSSLEKALVPDANPAFLDWLHDKVRGSRGINICIVDFVEKYQYVPSVLALNNDFQKRSTEI